MRVFGGWAGRKILSGTRRKRSEARPFDPPENDGTTRTDGCYNGCFELLRTCFLHKHSRRQLEGRSQKFVGESAASDFGVWPAAGAMVFTGSHRRCAGLNAKRQTSNAKLQSPASMGFRERLENARCRGMLALRGWFFSRRRDARLDALCDWLALILKT